MSKVLLKPKEGLRVKDPKTMQALPPEGKKVALNTYWLRRLKVGDVVKCEEPAVNGQPENSDNAINNERAE